MKNSIILSSNIYIQILGCSEYRPFILHKKNEDCFYIDLDKLPKEHYLTINGDYAEGFKFAGKINDFLEENGKEAPIVKVEYDRSL
jgi:hypothetical protein